MRYVATLHYTEELARSAVLSFWKRSVSWKLIAAIGICVAGFVFLLRSGDRSWSIGVLGTVLFFAVLLVAMIYVVHLRQSLQKLRALENPVATFEAEEVSFTLTSDVGSSTFKWTAVHDIWQFERYWLLLFSRAQFVTLPLVDIPGDMQSYVLARVMASRARNVG
jgi:drug/metabolite transporter (DMT)-like permease